MEKGNISADVLALHMMITAIDDLLATPTGIEALPRVFKHVSAYSQAKMKNRLALLETMKNAEIEAVKEMFELKKDFVETELRIVRAEIEKAKEKTRSQPDDVEEAA